MSEEFFFGCPVLQRFTRIIEQATNWDLNDRDAWDEVRAKIDNERPPASVVHRRAILCVGFSYEEISFALVKLKHREGAAALRSFQGPLRAPEHLDVLLAMLAEIGDDLMASLVNDRMMLTELNASQLTLPVRERLRDAINITSGSTRLLQENWNNASALAPCGGEFAHVLKRVNTAHNRVFGYLKTIFGEHNER